MRVSVALSVWNGEPHVADAVASVLRQLGDDDELVVVDDGSTDGTLDALAPFGNRIRLIREPHRGLSASRNTSLDACRGRYQSFIDADDRWAPGALAALLEALETDVTTDVVVGLADEFLDETVHDRRAAGLREPQQGVRGWFMGSMLARRAVFDEVRFEEDRPMAITTDWLARARSSGVRFGLVDQVILERRLHAHNMTKDGGSYHQALLESLRANLDRTRPSR